MKGNEKPLGKPASGRELAFLDPHQPGVTLRNHGGVSGRVAIEGHLSDEGARLEPRHDLLLGRIGPDDGSGPTFEQHEDLPRGFILLDQRRAVRDRDRLEDLREIDVGHSGRELLQEAVGLVLRRPVGDFRKDVLLDHLKRIIECRAMGIGSGEPEPAQAFRHEIRHAADLDVDVAFAAFLSYPREAGNCRSVYVGDRMEVQHDDVRGRCLGRDQFPDALPQGMGRAEEQVSGDLQDAHALAGLLDHRSLGLAPFDHRSPSRKGRLGADEGQARREHDEQEDRQPDADGQAVEEPGGDRGGEDREDRREVPRRQPTPLGDQGGDQHVQAEIEDQHGEQAARQRAKQPGSEHRDKNAERSGSRADNERPGTELRRQHRG